MTPSCITEVPVAFPIITCFKAQKLSVHTRVYLRRPFSHPNKQGCFQLYKDLETQSARVTIYFPAEIT